MKGFITVRNEADTFRVCLPVSAIKAVVERPYGCFIETDSDKDGSIGVDVMETFDLVMSAMKQAL